MTDKELIDILEEVIELKTKAARGEWRAGRLDTLSYDGCGSRGPYKAVYVDDPGGDIHMGERLPATVCEAHDAVKADCRDNAQYIAAACNMPFESMLTEFRRRRGEVSQTTERHEDEVVKSLERMLWQPIETAPKDGTNVLVYGRVAGIEGKMAVAHYMPGGHCIEDHPPIDEG